MKSWKKTKREKRKEKIRKGRIVLFKLEGFSKEEVSKYRKFAKELGLTGLSELVRVSLQVKYDERKNNSN